MSRVNALFKGDIVLDQDAFQNAANRLDTLAGDMDALQSKIQGLLDDLRAGFATPAGDKFFQACGSTLLEPMKRQSAVIQHVSQNLRSANDAYKSVFEEYSNLNSSIES